MKKLLILALTAVASLGLTFGTALAFSADETYTSLDDLKGLTLELAVDDTFDLIYEAITPENPAILNIEFTSNDTSYNKMRLSSLNEERFYLDYGVDDSWTEAYDFTDLEWGNEAFPIVSIASTQTITSSNSALFLYMFNNYSTDITPEPVETPTMWQAILSGIGGFFAGMFSLLSGLFSGVVAVFYTNNTTTILLQAIIFTAAASLVAVAVYVIVRLIKSAIARLRGGVGAAKGGKKVIEYSISNGKGGYRDVSRKEYRRFRRRK